MISVQEAQQHILNCFKPVEPESCSINQGRSRVLAQDIIAESDLPAFDYSAMDGFALRSADLTPVSTSCWKLRVVADLRAGVSPDIEIKPGECARIMTGAPLPIGADAVIEVEATDQKETLPGTPSPAEVIISKPVMPGNNIRPRGEDLHRGDTVILKGTRLRAQEIGMLAMLGIPQILVYRKPVLAILSSGDELLPVDAPLQPGMIHETNSYTLTALAEAAGANVINLGIAKDTIESVRSKLALAIEGKADAIVSSAGVSMGAYDYVKEIIEAEGELNFWRVNIRPGKPLAFGRYNGIPIFGLPGNPVSAFIGFEVFVRPALEYLSGVTVKPLRIVKAILTESLKSDGRESYLRVEVSENNGRLEACLVGHQGSGNIYSLVRANALLIVPSGVKSVPANSNMDVWLFE